MQARTELVAVQRAIAAKAIHVPPPTLCIPDFIREGVGGIVLSIMEYVGHSLVAWQGCLPTFLYLRSPSSRKGQMPKCSRSEWEEAVSF